MTVFLTSSPTREITGMDPLPGLYVKNGFVDRLREVWPVSPRCLMIAGFPGEYERNDEMTNFYCRAVQNAGLSVECFHLWDHRTPRLSREELHSYQAIFLAGGHVPTQGRWFEEIGLRERLGGYQGLVIGTSAGSMNLAREVYVWPEEPGESTDPNHVLFRPGLGLADSQVLPHYQKIKDSWLDGRRLMEDITCSHSFGRRFYAIPDGSYILVRDGQERLYGEAWLVSEGQISRFCRDGESRAL